MHISLSEIPTCIFCHSNAQAVTAFHFLQCHWNANLGSFCLYTALNRQCQKRPIWYEAFPCARLRQQQWAKLLIDHSLNFFLICFLLGTGLYKFSTKVKMLFKLPLAFCGCFKTIQYVVQNQAGYEIMLCILILVEHHCRLTQWISYLPRVWSLSCLAKIVFNLLLQLLKLYEVWVQKHLKQEHCPPFCVLYVKIEFGFEHLNGFKV